MRPAESKKARADWHLEVHDGGHIDFYPRFVSQPQCDALLADLVPGQDCCVKWEQKHMDFADTRVKLPRRTCFLAFQGDIRYEYSGITNVAQKMPDSVVRLLKQVSQRTGAEYNAVFLNYYQDGNQYIGWHADDESETQNGQKRGSAIASISLGQERVFQVLHKKMRKRVGKTTAEKQKLVRDRLLYEFPLKSGDLLVMRGSLQQHWHHRVPKSAAARSFRINLTFRMFPSLPGEL